MLKIRRNVWTTQTDYIKCEILSDKFVDYITLFMMKEYYFFSISIHIILGLF